MREGHLTTWNIRNQVRGFPEEYEIAEQENPATGMARRRCDVSGGGD
jgi:hypothetical protein